MKNKSTILRVACVGSSLALAAIFILYRTGSFQNAAPKVETVNSSPQDATAVPSESPSYFPGSKSAPLVDPLAKPPREFLGGSKSAIIFTPDEDEEDKQKQEENPPANPELRQ